MNEQIDYRALRERVDKGVQRQKVIVKSVLFVISLVMYIIFMVMAWGVFVSNGGVPPQGTDFLNLPGIERTGDPLTGAMIMLSVGWFTALIFQFVTLIMDSKIGEGQIRAQVTGRELNKELERLGMDEPKEKRKGMMRLSEDGELEEIVDSAEDDEFRAAHPRKSG